MRNVNAIKFSQIYQQFSEKIEILIDARHIKFDQSDCTSSHFFHYINKNFTNMQAHLDKIEADLVKHPIEINYQRALAGTGRSQAFGIVNRRFLKSDYSRNCWNRPYLFKLLLQFGKRFVKEIEWNSITVNQNYQCMPHKDQNNCGESVVIAFGDYKNGKLKIMEGDRKGVYDVNRKKFKCDFTQVLHCVLPFSGDRYSLVYYQTPTKTRAVPTVRKINGEYVFFRGKSTARLYHPAKAYWKSIRSQKAALKRESSSK